MAGPFPIVQLYVNVFFSRPDDGEAGRLIAKILSSHELPHRPQVGRDPFTHSKTIGNENLVLNLSYTSSK